MNILKDEITKQVLIEKRQILSNCINMLPYPDRLNLDANTTAQAIDIVLRDCFNCGQLSSNNQCIDCKQPFSNDNVFTKLGWKETQISGMCECCFDALFKATELNNEEDSE